MSMTLEETNLLGASAGQFFFKPYAADRAVTKEIKVMIA